MEKRIRNIERTVRRALAVDRAAAQGALKKIRAEAARGKNDSGLTARIEALEARLSNSVRIRRERQRSAPALTFPPELPITARRHEIIAAVAAHRVVIVAGETGSGKTTQIPKYCLAAGRGVDGLIGCTQPRRIAATTVARRIAEELGEPPGQTVGYKIRFRDRTASQGRIKIMTDGILLAETQSDPSLWAYDTLIVDEAHERSLNIDFLLGLLRNLIRRRRDLRLVITSATIDTEKFAAAFDGAPVIEVSGRMYPVEVRYLPVAPDEADEGESSHVEAAVRTVAKLEKEGPFGDILVFMPTEQGIRETCELIEARRIPGVTVLPLFARLSAAQQGRVFAPAAGRKIIVATNIAETSITIPGIRYVVDSGLARISRYNTRSRTTALPVAAISRASADQRRGRCGRVADGVCIRLYSQEDYASRPEFTPPEILRANLAEVILRMISLGLGDVAAFPFIDRPDDRSVRDGFALLVELGAIEPKRFAPGRRKRSKTGSGYALTPSGRLMARMPVDPRLSRMLLEANRLECLAEVTVIAAALCAADPRERPAEKAQAADAAQAVFRDPASDFVTLLNIWRRYHETLAREKTTGAMKRFCTLHFLSFKRMREWRDVHAQLTEILRENRLRDRPAAAPAPHGKEREFSPRYEAIHRSLLSGFLSGIAQRKEKNLFQAAHGREAMVFPGSGLFNRAPAWLVAAEMVKTSRLFARTCAAVDPAWIEAAGAGLCKASHANPRWEKNRGAVVATEQVSLFGLILVADRTVPFGPVDPEAATGIFIEDALVGDALKSRFDFMVHNRRLMAHLQALEDRVRRRDILVTEDQIADFYRRRLDGVYDEATLRRWIRDHGSDADLRMTRDDLILQPPDSNELAGFPKRIELDGQRFSCTYRFAPDDPADGLTIRIPAVQAGGVSAEAADWLVPGMLAEKVSALIRGLPKAFRKRLVPVTETVETVMAEMPRTGASLAGALGEFLHRRFGVDIPASAWPADALPDHLRARIALVDEDGREVDSSRNPEILRQRNDGTTAAPDALKALRDRWERTGLTTWDFGDLPEAVAMPGRNTQRVFPALTVEGEDVWLRLFLDGAAAGRAHREGVAALAGKCLAKDLAYLKKVLKLPAEAAPWARSFGGGAALEAQCHELLVKTHLQRDICSQAAFDDLVETAGRVFRADAPTLVAAVTEVIRTGHETLSELARLGLQHLNRPPLMAFLEARQQDLHRLVPDQFVRLYGAPPLKHLVRYIGAVALRTSRGIVDLERDQAKAADIAPFAAALREELDALTETTSEAKRRALEDFFWLLEEFKVSVFAQELKTAVPVSKKRLEKRLGEIRRMA